MEQKLLARKAKMADLRQQAEESKKTKREMREKEKEQLVRITDIAWLIKNMHNCACMISLCDFFNRSFITANNY